MRGRCTARGCRTPIVQPDTGRPRRYCSDACRARAYRARERRPAYARSDSDEWYTPVEVFGELAERYGPFDLDPATCPASPLWPLIPAHYTQADDGLARPWHGRVWVNPPYSNNAGWVRRAIRAFTMGEVEVVVLLVPARTDTGWWAEALSAGAVACFRTGRVHFHMPSGRKGSPPFASAALVFRDAGAVTKPWPADSRWRGGE